MSNQIKIHNIMELFSKLNISYFRLQDGEFELELKKPEFRSPSIKEPIEIMPLPKEENLEAKKISNEIPQENANLHVITSPIPGTFYRASAPGEKPFVEVGDKLKVGDVLCIIEAMKVMNKIESDVSGEVVEILLEDAQIVEYGTPLMKIRKF